MTPALKDMIYANAPDIRKAFIQALRDCQIIEPGEEIEAWRVDAALRACEEFISREGEEAA